MADENNTEKNSGDTKTEDARFDVSSLAALMFNLVLFFGVSMLPAWQMGYNYFRPLIERIFGTN